MTAPGSRFGSREDDHAVDAVQLLTLSACKTAVSEKGPLGAEVDSLATKAQQFGRKRGDLRVYGA